MSGVYEDQGIEGLSDKLMDVVKEFKGDNSEVEVLKHIIIQSNLLLATANVRYFLVLFLIWRHHFTSNNDCASEAIVNEETNEVKEDMKKLAEATSVVKFANFAEHLKAYFSALLEINMGEDKVISGACI